MARPLVKNKNNSKRSVTSASETIPEWTVPAGVTGDMLPARVVYVEGGKLIPALPDDPDLDKPTTVAADIKGWRKLSNGLTPRTDIMARLVARGLGGVAAYRAARKLSSDPIRDSRRAWDILGHPKVKRAIAEYRTLLERESRQRAVGMRDFVLGRLTVEAQTAPESAARIKALDLLGKTEGMFTTVHRTERVMDAAQLSSMKAQLYQRIRATLASAGHAMPATLSHDTGSESGIPLPQEPHPLGNPLISSGSHPEPGDTIPLARSGTPILDVESQPVDTGGTSPDGSMHREMTEDDL